MKNYELVILLQPQLSKEDHDKVINDIQKLIADNGGKIVATDDMGMMTLAHDITKLKVKQAYFISYHLELGGDKIQSLKATFAITKGVLRFSFFAMAPREEFISYADINKKWELEKEHLEV